MNLPHGGKLVYRVVSENQKRKILAKNYPVFKVDPITFKTVENLAQGVFSPLEGFVKKEDFQSILKRGRLVNDLPWTIPILFSVKKNQFKKNQKVILKSGKGLALFRVEEVYSFPKKELALKVYGTLDPAHPKVKKIFQLKDYLAGGKILLLEKSKDPFRNFIVTPIQTRKIFQQRGWQTIVAFQTRNVPHLGHEFLQKTALNICQGLFINPVIGPKKPGDFKDSLIKKSYQILLKFYFPQERVFLGAVNYEMQYAGPKEAILHAIIRKNFGCTHFIVGRDHAGVGDFYPPFAAQEIFKEYPDLGIQPLFFSSFFWCKKCQGIVSETCCPHSDQKVEFKGTKLRKLLLEGKNPSKNLMRPEVVEIIKKFKNPFV